MKHIAHQQLHVLEDDIIQIDGLLKALQNLNCDDGAHICVINATDDRFQLLKQNFYTLWREVIL